MFYFCEVCRISVLTNQVVPVGEIVGKNGGIVAVNRIGAKNSGAIAKVDRNAGTLTSASSDIGTPNQNVDNLGNSFVGFGDVGTTSQQGDQNLDRTGEVTAERELENSVGTNLPNSESMESSVGTSVDRTESERVEVENLGDEEGWNVVGNKTKKVRRNSILNRNVENRQNLGTENSEIKCTDIYVAGDSIVRHQGQNLRNKTGLSKNEVNSTCISGGRIEQVGQAVINCGKPKDIILSVGTNEIGKTGYIGITKKYSEIFENLANSDCNVIIAGILPRLKESQEWGSKAIAINRWLEQQCALLPNFTFLDLWDVMYANRYYYSKDGIHLNFKGRAFFTEVILNKIRACRLERNFLGHPQEN